MDQKFPAIVEHDASGISRVADRVIDLQPKLLGKEPEFRTFCRSLFKQFQSLGTATRGSILERARLQIRESVSGAATKGQLALTFTCSVLIDMLAQGWDLSVDRKRIALRPPTVTGVTPEELKMRVRQGHLLERDAQLREASVSDFIKGMEKRRLGPRGWVSIFSLMRDGRDLADKLRPVAFDSIPNRRIEILRQSVAPYLQLIETGRRCEHTGLLLTDIWRYFRHTWASTYKSQPGRTMMILLRDSAAPCHPVIGIAALGSSMAQQTHRDKWIGWDSETFVENLRANPSEEMAKWVNESTSRLIKAVYISDFVKERILSKSELRTPKPRTIARLANQAKKFARYHVLNPDAAKHKSSTETNSKIDWERQATTALFRSKRAKTLARLLEVRATLNAAGLKRPSAAKLRGALSTSAGRNAIGQLVRMVKAEHVGVDMMDIVVCGAVAPYNILLGGKLVCLLLGSPEVVTFYRERYGRQASIIASSIKGKPVLRTPNLVLLATTSLYGVISSQYNRLRVPLEHIGGRPGSKLEYLELGVSKGFGSYHYSQSTIDFLEILLGRAGDGRKVNSIFGEGVNPLMRKLREGLDLVGLSGNEFLKHGNARAIYGIQLADNFRAVLLGLSKEPQYLLPLKKVTNSTQRLAEFWRMRWLSGRISRPGILESLEKHTLVYPVTHGARVFLPEDKDDGTFSLSYEP